LKNYAPSLLQPAWFASTRSAMICQVVQALLDSTPIPRAVLENILLPYYLPHPDLARAKMAAVMRSLQTQRFGLCLYCQKQKPSVNLGKTKQPFNINKSPDKCVTACLDCRDQHKKDFTQYYRRSAKKPHWFDSIGTPRYAQGLARYHGAQRGFADGFLTMMQMFESDGDDDGDDYDSDEDDDGLDLF
jgi:hypothetical protein